MSFLKELGSFVGEVAGELVGGAVNIVGDITDSDFIKEIGDGVKRGSAFAGDKLGEVASGTWDIAAGIVTQDEAQLNAGFNDMGKAVGDTAKAAGHTICNVVENGSNVVSGLIDGDSDRLKDGAKGLVKFGVVGALSFAAIDLIDGADAMEGDSTTNATLPSADDNVSLVENTNSHHVEPHLRTLSDGTEIWVDGDGDTSVNTNEGWNQTNPDYRVNG